jgi:hypothetical protein
MTAQADAYEAFRKSDYIKRIVESDGNVDCVDVDGTAAPHGDSLVPPSDQQVEDMRINREMSESDGAYAQNTLRPIEMAFDEATHKAMEELGFERPPTLWGIDDNKLRVYIKPDNLPQCAHILRPHIFHSVGTGTWVRCGEVYIRDGKPYNGWRSSTWGLIQNMMAFDDQIKLRLGRGEDKTEYDNGLVNCSPPSERITLIGQTSEAVQAFVQRLERLKRSGFVAARRVSIHEEHRPEDRDYRLHLGPPESSKQVGFDRMVLAPCQLIGKSTSHIKARVSGDSKADIEWMLFHGYDAKVKALIAGGSPTTDYIIGHKRGQPYAGESFEWLARKLRPEGRKGHFLFKPSETQPDRLVIFGDWAYGDKQNTASVRAFFESEPR